MIHFDGWGERFDYVASLSDTDLHPAGYCDAIGHKLEKPKDYASDFYWARYMNEITEPLVCLFIFHSHRAGDLMECNDRFPPVCSQHHAMKWCAHVRKLHWPCRMAFGIQSMITCFAKLTVGVLGTAMFVGDREEIARPAIVAFLAVTGTLVTSASI